jgi:nitroimidazol reductase NimA-like FMN-containing flavoprotein (pyridoxamine 5'-phosphate oxidase superfamily)
MTTAQPRKTYEELKTMADDFLKERRLGVFATGRRDGSPQLSILSYAFDGSEVVIHTGSATAKVKNVRRRPRVSLAVTDGPRCVVVYGEARTLTGAQAEAYAGGPVHSGRQGGEPTLIVFAPETYRWARLEG